VKRFREFRCRGLTRPTTGGAGCCARATTGHATAAPPSSVMNSRRLMCPPLSEDHTLPRRCRNAALSASQQNWPPMAEMGSSLRRLSGANRKTSARGPSALPSRANSDLARCSKGPSCSISSSALATAKSSAASTRGRKARRCGRARVFFLALFCAGVGAALPTHDALDHHGRDAREHGLGHRG
jgi:hypothetical protein